jgi:hypothetical protein
MAMVIAPGLIYPVSKNPEMYCARFRSARSKQGVISSRPAGLSPPRLQPCLPAARMRRSDPS